MSMCRGSPLCPSPCCQTCPSLETNRPAKCHMQNVMPGPLPPAGRLPLPACFLPLSEFSQHVSAFSPSRSGAQVRQMRCQPAPCLTEDRPKCQTCHVPSPSLSFLLFSLFSQESRGRVGESAPFPERGLFLRSFRREVARIGAEERRRRRQVPPACRRRLPEMPPPLLPCLLPAAKLPSLLHFHFLPSHGHAASFQPHHVLPL